MDAELRDRVSYEYRNEYEGFTPIGSALALVPVYRLNAVVSYVTRTAIPLLDKFICRLILDGVTEPREISEFLGVDIDVIQRAIDKLSCNNFIYDDYGVWRLSYEGSRAFKEDQKFTESADEVELLFDGIFAEFRFDLMEDEVGHQLKELTRRSDSGNASAALMIPARVFPKVLQGDLASHEASDAVSRLLNDKGVSAVEIKRFVESSADLVFHEYLLLIYIDNGPVPKYKLLAYDPCGSNPGPDYRVTQALLMLHDRGELDERLWANSATSAGESSSASIDLLARALADYDRSAVAQSLEEIDTETQETAKRLESVESLSATEVEQLRTGLRELEREKQKLITELQSDWRQRVRSSARIVMNCEIREKLIEALATAQEELYIVSPWITKRVVDSEFKDSLKRLLEQGVKITILYGIEPETPSSSKGSKGKDKEKEKETERLAQELRRLGEGYPVPPRIERANTHEKWLICDDRYVISGSFNFLSYKGEPGPGFRHENGILVEDPELIAQVKKMLDSRQLSGQTRRLAV
jgi:hypothetical protein